MKRESSTHQSKIYEYFDAKKAPAADDGDVICLGEIRSQGFSSLLNPALLPAQSSDVKEFARRLDLTPDSKFTEFDSLGFTVGHYLVETSDDTLEPIHHLDCLKIFLSDTRSKDSLCLRDREQGGTMLAWAVCQVNYAAVKCLLAAGSFLYTTHPNGNSLWDLAGNDKKMLKLLNDVEFELSDIVRSQGRSALRKSKLHVLRGVDRDDPLDFEEESPSPKRQRVDDDSELKSFVSDDTLSQLSTSSTPDGLTDEEDSDVHEYSDTSISDHFRLPEYAAAIAKRAAVQRDEPLTEEPPRPARSEWIDDAAHSGSESDGDVDSASGSDQDCSERTEDLPETHAADASTSVSTLANIASTVINCTALVGTTNISPAATPKRLSSAVAAPSIKLQRKTSKKNALRDIEPIAFRLGDCGDNPSSGAVHGMLDDEEIRLCQQVHQKKFPTVQGWLPVALAVHRDDGYPRMSGYAVQIHNDHRLHWLTSARTASGIFIADSNMQPPNEEIVKQVIDLYSDSASLSLDVTYLACQQQRGSAQCGDYAVLHASLFAARIDSSRAALVRAFADARFDQCKMREYITACIQQGACPLTGPPRSPNTTQTSTEATFRIDCITRSVITL